MDMSISTDAYSAYMWPLNFHKVQQKQGRPFEFSLHIFAFLALAWTKRKHVVNCISGSSINLSNIYRKCLTIN